MMPIGVLGAGSWGTALAVHYAAQGQEVLLWARRHEAAEAMAAARINEAYLPGVHLPECLRVTADLAPVVACDPILVVVPSHGYRQVLREVLRRLDPGRPHALVSATKGIELETHCRMSEVTAEEAERAGVSTRFAVLSGPNFAAELAVGMPSAAVVASPDEALATELQRRLTTPTYRLYSSSDVVGVEIVGAAKNVIAIGAGVLSGLGLGHNTMAALITRGLHEISRLGVACGGDLRTFSGLAGLGDLVLTCTGGLSRNRRTGIALAQGQSLAEILASTTMVAEGVRNSVALLELARAREVVMPITEQMVAILHEGKAPRRALEDLMGRQLRPESQL